MTTTKTRKTPATRAGGDRLVRITDGTGYVHNANTTFGICYLGEKAGSQQYTLEDAVGILADLRKWSNNAKLYAELV